MELLRECVLVSYEQEIMSWVRSSIADRQSDILIDHTFPFPSKNSFLVLFCVALLKPGYNDLFDATPRIQDGPKWGAQLF